MTATRRGSELTHLMVRWGFLGRDRDRRSVGENPPPFERIWGKERSSGKNTGAIRTVTFKV